MSRSIDGREIYGYGEEMGGVVRRRGSGGTAVSTSGLNKELEISRSYTFQNVLVLNGFLHQQAREWSPISVRIHSPGAHPFLVAILNLNHANRVPTTKGEGSDHLVLECGHRGLESRERALRCHPSQGRLRFRQYPPHNDQGIFPPLLRRGVPSSYVFRIP